MESGQIEPLKNSNLQSAKLITAKLLNPAPQSGEPLTVIPAPPKEENKAPTYSARGKEITKALFNPSSEPLPLEPKIEAPATPLEEPKVTLLEVEEAEPTEETSLRENYLKLKKTHKDTKSTLKTLEQEKLELETKVKAYSTGEVVPEEVTRLRNRIAELEPLEEVLNVKKSPAYHAKVSSLNSEISKLNEVAKDYGLPESIMEQASHITNRKDLNSFLLNHFDEVGALEVKGIIGEVQKIRSDIQNVENRPKEAANFLNQEYERISSAKEADRKAKIIDSAKSGWTKAILGIRQEGKILELIPRQDDPEFNKKWVEPLQNEASTQFGRLTNAMAERGLSQLDPEMAEGLGKMAVLATVALTAISRANAAETKLAELETNTRRTSNLLRPSPGSVGGGSTRAPESRPSSPKDAAKELLRKVGVNY